MRDLSIRITIDGAEKAKRDLADIDKGVDAVGSSADKAASASGGLGKLEGSLTKFGAAVGGIAALDKAADNLIRISTASVTAFSEQEAALKKLETALTAQGVAVPETMALYEGLATQFQSTTVFSDDLINEMQALLVQVGNVAPAEMEKALTAATNLAAGLGVDLRTATMLVGKVFEGETGTLKRYGIVIDEAKLKADPLGATLDAIHAKFGGQAQAQMDTYTGKMAHLSNQWNDFKERLGLALATVLEPVLTWFMSLPDPVQTATFVVAALGSVLAPLAAGFTLVANALGVSVIPLLARALPAALTGLKVFIGPVGWFLLALTAVYEVWQHWDTIGPMVQRIYNAVKTWLVDRFRAVVESIKGAVNSVTGVFKNLYDKVVGNSYVPDLIQGIAREFGKLPTVMVAPAQAAGGAVEQQFSGLLSFLKLDFTQGWGGTLSSLFSGPGGLQGIVGNGLRMFGDMLIPGFGSILASLAPVVMAGLQKLGALFADFFSSIWDGIQAIGRALGGLFGYGGDPGQLPPGAGEGTTSPFPGAPPSDIPGSGEDFPGLPQFALGGIVPGLGPRLAMVHGGEGVLNPGAMARLGSEGLRTLNTGGAVGGVTNVTVYVDGEINTALARRRLVADVKRALDDDYRLRRKVSAR
jgi:hypothetical protein